MTQFDGETDTGHAPSDREMRETLWDVIVIGTGMGGAALGYRLAQSGKKVLFCEQGRSFAGPSSDSMLAGGFAETFFARGTDHSEVLARSGRFNKSIEDRSKGAVRRYTPLLGSGTGGSTLLYGAVLERFHPGDFSPRQYFPGAADAALPEAWPISYEDLRPYYREVETLFQVRGTVDPLQAAWQDPLLQPAPISGVGAEFFDLLQKKGCHPFRTPVALKRGLECLDCTGYVCSQSCKSDALNVFLRPALEKHGARLLDQCRVQKIEASRTRVDSVVCIHAGEVKSFKAKAIVLAAGAIESPCLLLRSKSRHWPNGLANDSGLVGRNLMRHFLDFYVVQPRARDGLAFPLKEISINDLYFEAAGNKWGTLKSFSAFPPPEVIFADLKDDLRNSRWAGLSPLLSMTKPIIKTALEKLLSESLYFASIIEDLPYSNNRVWPTETGEGIQLQYEISSFDAARISACRQRVRQILHPYRTRLLPLAKKNKQLAHVCGTCRFGTNPKESVLDADNKAHALDNLYLVDSSFFPSSGGTNPALTIGANALRVASKLLVRI